MASELYYCEICGVQCRYVSDGVHPVPESYPLACEEHLSEWTALNAVRELDLAHQMHDASEVLIAEKEAAATEALLIVKEEHPELVPPPDPIADTESRNRRGRDEPEPTTGSSTTGSTTIRRTS